MKHKIDSVFGIGCFVVAFFLIGYYLILEFSIVYVASPMVRLRIIGFIILLMYFGSFFLNRTSCSFSSKFSHFNMCVWFLLYVIMLLNLTLFDKYFGRSGAALYLSDRVVVQNYFEANMNLIPFATIQNYIVALKNHNLMMTDFMYNIFGNLFAFMPFAFFIPRLFPKIDKWYQIFFLISGCILFVETMQMVLMSGSFDIDDYILNIVGAMLFYFVICRPTSKKIIDRFLYFHHE